MSTLRSSALACAVCLDQMVDQRMPCSYGHPLFSAMRALQKRYTGSFPLDLRQLWEQVRLPPELDAPVEYHDGYERLKNWLVHEFVLGTEELSNGRESTDSSEEGTTGGGTIDGQSFDDRLVEVEEGLDSSEESDFGSTPSEGSATQFEGLDSDVPGD